MKEKKVKTNAVDATLVLAEGQKTVTTLSEWEHSAPGAPHDFSERYQWICDFASGGVGVISKAKDTVFDRIVAVKKLNDKYCGNPAAVDAFLEESRLNARLDHPSIVPVYAMGRNREGQWECAMKLIGGTSLWNFIGMTRDKYDVLRISQAQEHHALNSRLEYFLKICEAVDYCHSMKIVHGDIKPDNILMGRFGEVYLMDWGCAKKEGSKLDRLSGTPNFMPPEFFDTKLVSRKTDIFALGMILFELVTLRPGKQQCSGGRSLDCSCALVYNLKDYSHYKKHLKIGHRIKAVIVKAINPDPAERYNSVEELAADVRHFIYDEEVGAAPDNVVRKFARVLYRNRVKTVLAGFVLILLFAGGLFSVWFRAVAAEQRNAADLTRRLTLQSYTDRLAGAVEKEFLAGETSLRLFAENLVAGCPVAPTGKYPGPADFAQLPDSAADPLYTVPVRFDRAVRIRRGTDAHFCESYFVKLCGRIRSNGESPALRFLMQWTDGAEDMYPAANYDAEELSTEALLRLPESPGVPNPFWTIPVRTHAGQYRISCKYRVPELGVAGLEFRMESLLASLLRANRADPVHELYLFFEHGKVIEVTQGELALTERDAEFSSVLQKLKSNNMQQVIIRFGGNTYYVSASLLPSIGATLIQMIEVEAMKNHNHVIVL